MERSPFYPFPARPGMFNEVSQPLDFNEGTAEVSEDVINFEHQLYDASLDPGKFPQAKSYKLAREAEGSPLRPLEEVWREKNKSTDIGVSYFLTDEGKRSLANVTDEPLDFDTLEDCLKFLCNLDIKQANPKVLDKLQADSIGYEESQLTEKFVKEGFRGHDLPSPQIVTLYKNPKAILHKAKGYHQLKAYIKIAQADLNNLTIDPKITSAEDLAIDVYRKKINRLIADVYTDAYKFLKYSRNSDSDTQDALLAELAQLMPAFNPETDQISAARFLENLDHFKHGVSEDEAGNYTWLSSEASKLSQTADQDRNQADITDRGDYRGIDPEVLESIKVDGPTFGKWLSIVLKEYDLLSSSEEWDSERSGPAPDGKWQIIVNDKFKALAVDDRQRVMHVPNANRSVLSAIKLANHEIAHVIQHENKRAVSKLAIMQTIGLNQVSEQTESGAKWQEKVANETLTGKPDLTVPGTGYMKALEVKSRGGSFGECVEAYYNDLRVKDPTLSPESAAARAVNRTRRIFRSGGFEFAQDAPFITNTQPLSYLEQKLIYESMDEQQRRLLFIGGISIRNLLRLSDKGLVDINKIYVPERMPLDILLPEVRKIISG